MAKRIPSIGYIEFKDGRKVDIINAIKLPDGDIELVAVDGLYRYHSWSVADEIDTQYGSLKFKLPQNSLYRLEAYSEYYCKLVRQYDFIQFVLFRCV